MAANIVVHPYEASGGDSANIEVDGNSVRIEAHEGGYSVVVPTELGAMEAWNAVSSYLSKPAPDNEAKIFLEGDNERTVMPSSEAIDHLEGTQGKVLFFRMDLDGHAFIWRTVQETNEVGVSFDVYEPETIRELVKSAGVIAVRNEVETVARIARPLLEKYGE
jgi:hypothetical protein